MFLTLTVSANAWGAEYTITFKSASSDSSSDLGATPNVSNVVSSGASYVASFSGCSKMYVGKSGIKLGSNSATGTMNFTLATNYQNNIKSIKVVSAKYGSDTGTLTLYSGGSTSLKSGISPGTDYTYTFSSPTKVTSLKLATSSKRAYITKIVITTEEAATCTTPPTVSSASNSNITSTTATVSCSSGITSLGSAGCSIESYGFVYGTSSNPTISNTKVQVGTTYTTTGTAFSKGLTGLTANTTYYVRPYATNGNGTAYGTQTSFKTLELPKYTVTLNAGPGTCAASVTETSAGAGVELLEPTLDCGDWKFAGWAEESVNAETTTKPTLIPAGAYNPASNITLYAVYQRTETTEGGGSGDYELVTSAPDDWSGTYLIVDGTSKNCFNGSLTTLDAGGNYETVTISNNNTITANTTTDSYSVTISKSTTNGKYYIKTASGYYIGSTVSTSSDGNELKSSTSTKYDNSISINSNNVTIKGPDHILKFFYQSGQSWRFRFYKSTTTQNVRLPQLYKKSSGSSTTTYYHSTPDCADPCDALQAPNVMATATANSITLSWAAVSGATSYNIYNYTTEETDETINLTYTFNGLDSETEYEWEVEAVSATCNGKGSKGTTTTQKACTDAVNVIKGTPSNGSFNLDKTEKQSTCNGAVTVTLSDIQPAAGYKFSAITQSGINTGVTIDNNNQKVTYAQNTIGNSTINVTFTELPKYTVSFSTGTGNPTQADVIESVGGQGITLPVGPAPACPDWTFAGWAEADVKEPTTEPTLFAEGTNYKPVGNCTLYAVYSTTAETTGFTGYEKVTEEPEDWSGKYLLSTGTYTATGAFDSNRTNGHLVRETYTPGIDEKTEWEFTLAKVDNTGYSILFPDGTWYLGHYDGTSFGRSIDVDNAAYLWTPSTNGISNVNATTRKIADDSTDDFRPYSSPSSSNIVYLYKRVGGGSTTIYNSNPDCTPPSEYTITWWANGEEFCTQTDVEGTTIEVPASSDVATYACDDKVFIGWVDAEIIGSTDTKPSLITEFGNITEDKNFFAVFASVSSVGVESTTHILTPNAIWSGYKEGTIKDDQKLTWSYCAAGQQTSGVYSLNLRNEDTEISYIASPVFTANVKSIKATIVNGSASNRKVYICSVPTSEPTTGDLGITKVEGRHSGELSLAFEGSITQFYIQVSDALQFQSIVVEVGATTTYSGYVTTCEKPTYTRDVTSGDYGTICIPYASSSYSGAEFYEISWMEMNGATPKGIWLDEVNGNLTAGKPYIFKATNTVLTVNCTGTAVATPVEGVAGLTGTFEDIPNTNNILEGNYMISGNQFLLCPAGCWLNANRAYIDASIIAGHTTKKAVIPGRRRVCLGENVSTGFENVTNGENTTIKVIQNGQLIIIRNGEKFNAQGQKL